ncbi:transposase [Bacillus sp. FJAT-49736]|nr:DUF6262 family protein [Bacillus sp. FJAT-49736]MBS4172953.1 transposase [Bacillus sp. FJAT-49736]
MHTHLKHIHELKRKRSIQKVQEAIELLTDQKEKINFNSISKASGVSKATLYKNPEIRALIEKLRKQNPTVPTLLQIRREKEEKFKGIMISALKKKIKILEEENNELREELNQAYKCLEKYRNSAS